MKTHFFIGLALVFVSASSFALMPPQYLSVPGWKSCVSQMKRGSARYVCLPDRRPRGCPRDSWEELNDEEMIDSCYR